MTTTTTTTSIYRPDILAGRTALVTGGGSGICRGIAEGLARHGARVFIVSRNAERLKAAADEMGAAGLQVDWHALDVRDAAQVDAGVKACVERMGGVDILVNGAAGNFLCPAAALSPNGFRTVVEIDLVGTFNMCRAAFEPLQRTGQGCILNVSATLHYTSTPLMTHAVAAKAGVDALTRNLATEWGPMGVRVNGVAPGPIEDTEGMARLLPPGMKQRAIDRIPSRRFGTIAEIADAAIFLCSPAATYINGHTLVVDGAQWLAGRLSMEELAG